MPGGVWDLFWGAGASTTFLGGWRGGERFAEGVLQKSCKEPIWVPAPCSVKAAKSGDFAANCESA